MLHYPQPQDVLQMSNNPKVISFILYCLGKKVFKITPFFFPVAISFPFLLKGVLSTSNNSVKLLPHTFAM